MENQKSSIQRWHKLIRQFLGEDFFEEMIPGVHYREPNVDVYHTAKEVIVLINLPGLTDVHNIQIRVGRDTLEVEGEIPTPYPEYHVVLSEREKGHFKKQIPLGVKVKRENTTVRYRRGVLEIRLMKEEKENMLLRFHN